METGSWWSLVSVLEEARANAREDANARPTACPNDGEPLRTGPDGKLYCTFDGYRPGQ